MSQNDEKQHWCSVCGENQTFYRPTWKGSVPLPAGDAGLMWRCSMCEATEPEQPGISVVSEEPEGVPVAGGEPLQDDLDHIRIQLTGPWSNEDLKNLAADLEESAAGAKEGGLGLAFFAVKKTAARKARESGSIIVPFRDRHGRIMPVPPLSLSPNRVVRPS